MLLISVREKEIAGKSKIKASLTPAFIDENRISLPGAYEGTGSRRGY